MPAEIVFVASVYFKIPNLTIVFFKISYFAVKPAISKEFRAYVPCVRRFFVCNKHIKVAQKTVDRVSKIVYYDNAGPR